MTNKYRIQLRDRDPFTFNADHYSVGNSFTRFRLGKEFKTITPLLTINNLDIVSIEWVSREWVSREFPPSPDFTRNYQWSNVRNDRIVYVETLETNVVDERSFVSTVMKMYMNQQEFHIRSICTQKVSDVAIGIQVANRTPNPFTMIDAIEFLSNNSSHFKTLVKDVNTLKKSVQNLEECSSVSN